MSQKERAADEITVPVKRTEGETLEERMTGNAYQNILPARYLRKDSDGNLVESQDELFERIAENVALAEAVFEAQQRDDEIAVRPDQLKPNHPRRDELAGEVFGAGTTVGDDVETDLSVYNVNKFAYETIVPELPEDIREHVEGVAHEYQEAMEHLSFIPNSPTIMNAGDELQQLSACFVDSPDDDLTDIHQTAKEAAEVFQCLTDDTKVFVEDRGIVSIADVEPGDAIQQCNGDDYRTQHVEEIHAYDEAPTRTIRTEGGIELTGTPNHRLLVNGEWTEIGEITSDDTVSICLGWIPDLDNTKELTSVERGPQWQANRTVSNEAIATLHAEGLSDYAIAEQLDSSSSTVHRRRADELGLPPNGSGGRKKGRDFDEKKFERLYEAEYTDGQIAAELGVHSTTVRGFRSAQSLSPNGKPAKSVTQPSQLTEDLAELLGYWIGDGSIHQNGMRFHVSREEVLEHIDCLSRRLFDTGMDWTWKEGCYEAVIHSHEIKRWWLENFGEAKRSSADAALPNCIWQADHNRIHAFLRGLFTADGTLNRDKYPRLYSASERLIDEAHQLLLGIGVPSKKWTWDTDDREYFTVAPTGKCGLEQYSSSIGFLDERTEVMAEKLARSETRQTKCGTLTNETTWEQEIVAVSDAGEQTVYDVTVSDNPEYIASSIVSHNSGGGMGYAFWQLRPYGDPVGSTGGIASGPITFMRTYDQLCFVPGTNVLTPAGQVQIEDLQVGDVVVDENGTEQTVTETMERTVSEDIVEITPERINKPVQTTREHPFKVVRGDSFEWVDAKDIEEGDLLVLGSAVSENSLSLDDTIDLTTVASGPLVFTDGGISINREYYGASKGSTPESLASEVPVTDLATIAGWYLAEGCVVYRRGIPSSVNFTLHSKEQAEAAEIRDALDSFGVSSRMEVIDDRNTLNIFVESSSFAQFILGIFGTGAAEKTVPEFLWTAPPAVQARVLEALFDGDGRLEKRGKSQRAMLKTTCEEVIDFAFQAGLRCGVQFSRHDREPEDRKPTYSVGASVSSAIDTPLECLFDEVPDDFVPRDRTKQANGREVVAVRSTDRVDYDGPVYNVEATGTHTYLAEDIVVHNCETIAQGGTRRGAQMGVMRVSHPDVIEFIHAKNKDVSLAHTLRLNDPDDYTYTSFEEALEEARGLIDEEGHVPKHLRNAVEGHLSNFNISVGVTDGFMEALYEDEEFTFTNPRTGEPHVATAETKEMYARYDLGEYVEVGEPLSLPAEILWDRIVQGAHENGEPGVIYLERVNKEHSFDVEEHPDHRILATNPCVTGETVIRLADGTERTVEELASEGEARVLCRNAETDQIVAKVGRDPRKTRSDAEVIRVQTEAGASLVCTPDHDIWTPSGYVPAGELDAGDEIVGSTSVETRDYLTETLTVAYTEPAGEADVYNITIDDHHNYLCRTEGEEGYLSVANCGEQPLEEYEACNLGHINLSTIAALDAPDWRVWSAEHADEYDSHEAAIESYLKEAIDIAEFDRRIELGTRFLEDVVTMSDFPVKQIEEKVRELRKIGLGIMGLAQLYIQLGVRYGSDTGNEVARQLMMHINHRSKQTSHELALERGSFDDWEDSKYANPTEYREWFEHHTGESADDWENGLPIRNHNTTTIAPTGTTSMVGNTTGGCEPIYNVAYYKNVSDDVQGDEMLVEFDDYFLRVLEANDIDPETVKAEAQEQMANNVFDGVSSLSTVPDAISELFVVTADISAKEHAAVQCASQAGVDSAISKTVNAPNDSTMEDAKEVFEYIYDHGGKGVTYYRDGTRSKQVLTTRADNAEFADEHEAAAAITKQISEVFGDIEDFLGSEEVKEELDEDIEALLTDQDREQGQEGGAYARERPRPDVLYGVTQRVETGYGKMYVNINEDEKGEPFELFATIGNSGGFTASFTEGLAKTISYALRSGVDPREIAKDLQGIRSPKVAWDKGEQINSIPDAIGVAMRRYLDDEIERPYPRQQQLTELTEIEETETQSQSQSQSRSRSQSQPEPATDAGPNADVGQDPETDGGAAKGDTQSLIDAGESPECPECGSMTLYFSEGCKTCESCGWSEC